MLDESRALWYNTIVFEPVRFGRILFERILPEPVLSGPIVFERIHFYKPTGRLRIRLHRTLQIMFLHPAAVRVDTQPIVLIRPFMSEM